MWRVNEAEGEGQGGAGAVDGSVSPPAAHVPNMAMQQSSRRPARWLTPASILTATWFRWGMPSLQHQPGLPSSLIHTPQPHLLLNEPAERAKEDTVTISSRATATLRESTIYSNA